MSGIHMPFRECTNCHTKMLPFEPRKRRGEHLLCKGCAQKPASMLKTADAEGSPGADLSSDFTDLTDHSADQPDLVEQYRTPAGHNEHGVPVNHLRLPTSAPEDADTEMWPETGDLAGPHHPMSAALPVSLWEKYAKRRQALGHPSPHRYKGKNDPLHKAAHKDHEHNDTGSWGSHSHHPYHPVVPNTLDDQHKHLTEKHLDHDGATAEKIIEAVSGNKTDADKMAALSNLHVGAHGHGDEDHGAPAGKPGHVHQHLHAGDKVMDDPNLADWEKELIGHTIDYDADEPSEGDGKTPSFEKPWPKKIKDHLKDEHNIDESNISGSDLFNHEYHDDLHEHDADHWHAPKPGDMPYMPPLPENSHAQLKAHLVEGHGHSKYDTDYQSMVDSQIAHNKAHGTGEWSGAGNGADHQHEDDTQPPKYGDGDSDAALKHLVDDHNLSALDHGWQHNVEKHNHIHKTQHSEHNQPHWHADENPIAITPPPPDKPGGTTYQAMVDHLKSGNQHNGHYYSGLENGSPLDSLHSQHKMWHEHYGANDHQHEDLDDPLGAGSTEELAKAEQGKVEHKHHEDMTPEEFAAHMAGPGHEWSDGSTHTHAGGPAYEQHETDHSANGADADHGHAAQGEEPVAPTLKSKKPNTNPQFGDRPNLEPEMYAWPHPEVPHPKNKSEVIQHLIDHHPEVDSQDYENSEFKTDGFLKGWHSHLHSGKEHEISPSDMHQHVDDDSKKTPRPGDNVFSHLITHHGYSEDEAKAMRHVDAVAHHEHTHQSGDDEEIGHQHDYAGAPPSEPVSWVVNPEYAGENHEHLFYHGTRHEYYCPGCGSEAGNRRDDCDMCGHAMKPASATENKRERGEWGNHGSSIYDCHVGPHFTTLYGMAKNFGHRVVAAKIKGKKPKYYDNLNHMAHDAYDRLHALGELQDGGKHLGKHYQDPKYTGVPVNSDSNSYGGCCSETLREYAQGKHRNDGKYGLRRFRDSLRADGYDHIIARNHADHPRGHLNLLPLSPKQIHVVDENHNPPSGDPRRNDNDNYNAPSGWSSNTMPNEKEKLRPPAYLVDKDPKIGNPYDLPSEAPEHPDDLGDPHKSEIGRGGFSNHDDDDDENSDDDYCSNCDTDGHGTYDSHCGDCEQYTGDGECDCSYCPACGHDTSHGNDPGEYHQYCEHCDNEGVEGGWTEHDSSEHEDEYGEHPEKFKDKDYCPHCETHDKENRNSDDCNNCGATLPDYDQIGTGSKKTKGNYPTPGGGTNQWDHTTHPWGHLVHDHGLDLSDEFTTPEELAAKHHAAHTGQLKEANYEHGTGLSYTPHDPEHTHPEFPQTKQWADMSRDEKVAHLSAHHQSPNATYGSLSDESLDAKHDQGHGYQYAQTRTPHQHVEGGETAPPVDHAPDNIASHMSLFHHIQPGHTGNYTPEQLHATHAEHHAMGWPVNEWHHDHTAEGLQLTGKHSQPPKDAADHIAAIEHLHEHHADNGSLPLLGYPMASVENTHLEAHKKGLLAPHTHPVSEGPHPDEDPYGHLKAQHGWTDEQVEEHAHSYGHNKDYAHNKHLFEHQHGDAAIAGSPTAHSHFGTPDQPIPAVPKAYKPPTSMWSTYEPHQQHMKDAHGFDAPAGQSGKFYKDLHHSMHLNPEVGQELGLDDGHDHHEHDSTGGTPAPGLTHAYVGGDSYSLHQHLKDYHPEEMKKATDLGFSYTTPVEHPKFKEANDLHEQAHKDGPEWMHTHRPDPNAPLHPDKGHLNDALMKHLVEKHDHDKDSVGTFPDNDAMVHEHISLHGTPNGNGSLPPNYEDSASNSKGVHSHNLSSLKPIHGEDIVEGKPTKTVNQTTDFDQTAQLANHLKHEHMYAAGDWHGGSDPKAMHAVHEDLHSGAISNEDYPVDHVHKQWVKPDQVEGSEVDADKQSDIDHIESHHGLMQHNLANETPGMVKMLHNHMHYNDGPEGTHTPPIKHSHYEHGTNGITYPPPIPKQNVHSAHDLAHHLEDEHGLSGVHGYDQATLLDAHAASHDEMKGNAAQGKPEHTHGVMYPFGHEKGEQPASISTLATHMQQEHYSSTSGKTPAQIAAAHEEAHFTPNGHKHSPEEMGALHNSTPVSLPPKAVAPNLPTHELDTHLKTHHGLDYGAQSNAGLEDNNIADWHDAEHSKGNFGHVHQTLPITYGGITQYPDNPVPAVPEGKTHEHLTSDHGVHVAPGEAEKMHQILHNGYATTHQHQPTDVPAVPHLSDNTVSSMQNHLMNAHGFTNKTIADHDIPMLHSLHDSSHEDQASLPFHTHLPKPDNDKVSPNPTTSTQLLNHVSKGHGLSPYLPDGGYKSEEQAKAEHDAHHAKHDAGGTLMHTHADPVTLPHMSPEDDAEGLKAHLQNHHNMTTEGYSASDLESEHKYHHNYNADLQTLPHTHEPKPTDAHADMSHEQLVKHLNAQHGTPGLKGDMAPDYYQDLHKGGHNEEHAKTLGIPHYPAPNGHGHPDLTPLPTPQDTSHAAIAEIPAKKGTGAAMHLHADDDKIHMHMQNDHQYHLDEGESVQSAHGKHFGLHAAPIDSNDYHGHHAPGEGGPLHVPQTTNADVNDHLLHTHNVAQGHWALTGDKDAHDFHDTLHAHPHDDDDKSHIHLASPPAGPAPTPVKMLHPNGLNIDAHLAKHGVPPELIPNNHDQKHEQHAALHKQDLMGSAGPHTHSKWTGEGNGIDHTASLVEFFEHEMAVD